MTPKHKISSKSSRTYIDSFQFIKLFIIDGASVCVLEKYIKRFIVDTS